MCIITTNEQTNIGIKYLHKILNIPKVHALFPYNHNKKFGNSDRPAQYDR